LIGLAALTGSNGVVNVDLVAVPFKVCSQMLLCSASVNSTKNGICWFLP